MIKTNEIIKELKKSVFGQDEYLKALAVTGYKHQLKNKLIGDGNQPINSNLLVIGPSGSGKTFSVKLLSKILKVPFYEVNCSTICEVGYKGFSIEDALVDMMKIVGPKCQAGIVYLDEFDKVLDMSLFVDGKGPAQQQDFLKILEPNQLRLKSSDRTSTVTSFDTSGVTFIATGSFEGVKESIRLKNMSKMGFNSVDGKEYNVDLTENDLIEHHYMPELVGRFSRIININQLTKNDFYDIVKQGSNSIITSYKSIFNDRNIELNIDDAVYKYIADHAYSEKTGARNINKVIGVYLDDCLNDISNDFTISKVHLVLDKNRIETKYEYDPERTEICDVEVKEDNRTVKVEEYRNNVKKYIETLNLKIRFYNSLRKGFLYLFDEYGDEVKYTVLFDTLTTRKNAVESMLKNTVASSVDAEELRVELKVYNYLLDKYSDENVKEKEVL